MDHYIIHWWTELFGHLFQVTEKVHGPYDAQGYSSEYGVTKFTSGSWTLTIE